MESPGPEQQATDVALGATPLGLHAGYVPPAEFAQSALESRCPPKAADNPMSGGLSLVERLALAEAQRLQSQVQDLLEENIKLKAKQEQTAELLKGVDIRPSQSSDSRASKNENSIQVERQRLNAEQEQFWQRESALQARPGPFILSELFAHLL